MRRELEALLAAAARGERPRAAAHATSQASETLPQFRGLRVLVADDSAVNREVAIAALRRLGAKPEVVENGLQAVEAVAAGQIDVVLMDGSMPELDGFEATRRIRSAEQTAGRPRLPIVAVTAHVVGSAADAWREAGMDAVLYKPFTLRSLGERLAPLLQAAGAGTAERPYQSDHGGASENSADELPILASDILRQLDDMAAAGQGDFVQRVFTLYLEHAPRTAGLLAQAVAANNPAEVARHAHALKSMSLNMGARRVSWLAAALETDGKAGRIDPRQADSIADALTETCGSIRVRLDNLSARGAPDPSRRETIPA
jgi:CheY-like chemotaxis protein